MTVEALGMLAPGRLLRSRYRLRDVIGTGGMASVWLAEDEALGRRVAVKIIADTLAADHAWVRRFEREARIAASLQHANVVPVYDLGSEAGRPFLVMHYVPGGTLAQALADGRALDARALARDLLEAVAHIHDAGLVHRDIKPSNVLLELDGTPRLTDFGIAQPPDATRLTSTGNVLGTARYLAPEVLAGEPASARSDLFGCGRVLEYVAGDRSARALSGLIAALTAADPARRVGSARSALEILDGAPTEPTRRLQRTPRMPLPRTARARSAEEPRRRARSTGSPPPRAAHAPVASAGGAMPRWIGLLPGIAAALVVVALILGALTSGSGKATSEAPHRAPANAPLARQLTTLAQQVQYATKH
jgi:eukaryotic-like serine/threonine-protein kinase